MNQHWKYGLIACLAFCVAVGLSTGASAQAMIDFEIDPAGGTPVLNDPISTQFEPGYGVTFSLDPPSAGFPMFGDYGNTAQGWTCDKAGKVDYLDPSQGFDGGSWFLYYPDARNNTLVITYTIPVQEFSFSIIDIDGQEEFDVEVHTTNFIVHVPVCPTCAPPFFPIGDCLATRVWWRTGPAQGDIHEIRISATSNTGIGFAMDNFSPASITEKKYNAPSTTAWGIMVLVAMLLVSGVIAVRRHRVAAA